MFSQTEFKIDPIGSSSCFHIAEYICQLLDPNRLFGRNLDIRQMVATPHLSSQGTSLMYVGGLDQYPLLTGCDREEKRFLKCLYIMKEDSTAKGFCPLLPISFVQSQ